MRELADLALREPLDALLDSREVEGDEKAEKEKIAAKKKITRKSP